MTAFFTFVIGLALGIIAMNYLWEEKIKEIIRTGEYDMLLNKDTK